MSQNDPCGEEDLAMVGDEGFGAELLVAARGDDLVFDVDTLAMADDEGFGFISCPECKDGSIARPQKGKAAANPQAVYRLYMHGTCTGTSQHTRPPP